jgi:hypothetical protein
MKRSIYTLDDDFVRDLSEYSPSDIGACLSFLESLFCPTWDSTSIKKKRALTLVLCFHKSMSKLLIQTDGTEAPPLNGCDHMDLMHRTTQMVKCLCDALDDEKGSFRCNVSSDELLRKFISTYVCDGNSGVDVLSYNSLSRLIDAKTIGFTENQNS